MLTYSFADLGSDSLYSHLYKCIKEDIVQGRLAPGDKLPSKRALAAQLNVSTITVENAYGQLVAEGYLYSLPKRGYFVSNLSSPVSAAPAEESPALAEPAPAPEWFADFAAGGGSPEHFPFSVWARLLREVIAEKPAELMRPSPVQGIPELRQAIAAYLRQFRGMAVSPGQIVVGAGTEYLYGLLIQLLGRDKTYAVEDPGYLKIGQIYAANGVRCAYLPLDGQGIRVDALDSSGAEVVHISPSHHFPTGLVTPVGRRYELLGWASRSDRRTIIEDDYDCEFRLLGKPIPSLQSIDVMEKVIYMNTFTKSLAATIRISYLVLPRPLLERFRRELGFYACTVSNFEQYTLARFLRDGYFEKHIGRMRNFYHTQRDVLLSAIARSPLAGRVTISEEDAGLHFLMKVASPLSEEELRARAAAEGLRLAFLSQYCRNPGPETEHTLVISYSAVRKGRMEEAAERLCRCLL